MKALSIQKITINKKQGGDNMKPKSFTLIMLMTLGTIFSVSSITSNASTWHNGIPKELVGQWKPDKSAPGFNFSSNNISVNYKHQAFFKGDVKYKFKNNVYTITGNANRIKYYKRATVNIRKINKNHIKMISIDLDKSFDLKILVLA